MTKIIRKPKGFGIEIKDLADVDTGIMLVLELVENKDAMKPRTFTSEYGVRYIP